MKTKIFQRTFLIAFLALAGCFSLVSLGVAMTLLWIPQSALAAWPGDPSVNVPICTTPGWQHNPRIVSDGSGGAIIAWSNMSNDQQISETYAQRVDASGIVRWTENGVAICTVSNRQYWPTLVSDGSGGAIITWSDSRSGYSDIYAQRVDASGTLQWGTNAVPICVVPAGQYGPTLVSDGSGGAIITWHDQRSAGDIAYDNARYPGNIYAQRVNASGEVQWRTNGVPICTASGGQWNPQIVSDGSGGAIITWQDKRSGNFDIYAQRVNASGVIQWTENGVPICTASGDQETLEIMSDSTGGAIITWQDGRNGNSDIYAQRVNASGVVQWTENGVPICTTSGSHLLPALVRDGSGGAIITWDDDIWDINDIYAQCVNASGAVQWTENGVAICTASGSQWAPQIISDGAGGAIITWQDYRNGKDVDIYAQRVFSDGSLSGPPLTINQGPLYVGTTSQQEPRSPTPIEEGLKTVDVSDIVVKEHHWIEPGYVGSMRWNWTPDGKSVVFSKGDGIYIMNSLCQDVRLLCKEMDFEGMSRNCKALYGSRPKAGLFAINMEDGAVRQIASNCTSCTPSPDWSKLLYRANDGSGSVYVVNADDCEATAIAKGEECGWVGGANKVWVTNEAWVSGRRTIDVIVMNVDGAETKSVVKSSPGAPPMFSPSGAWIIYRDLVDYHDVMLRMVDENKVKLPLKYDLSGGILWFPGEDRIIVRDLQSRWYLLSINTSEGIGAEKLLGADWDWPTLSPNSRFIAFTMGEPAQLGIANADGTNFNLLTEIGSESSKLRAIWSPLGNAIAYGPSKPFDTQRIGIVILGRKDSQP